MATSALRERSFEINDIQFMEEEFRNTRKNGQKKLILHLSDGVK